jgi:hypothetical protein
MPREAAAVTASRDELTIAARVAVVVGVRDGLRCTLRDANTAAGA